MDSTMILVEDGNGKWWVKDGSRLYNLDNVSYLEFFG
jgi:hypothetical protein